MFVKTVVLWVALSCKCTMIYSCCWIHSVTWCSVLVSVFFVSCFNFSFSFRL